MKTEPMTQQVVAERALLDNPTFFGLAAEQGTGKTWMLMNDAERQFEAGRIQGLLVLAPKGVHTNWVLREIPTHMSVPTNMWYWKAGAGKRHMARLERLLRADPEDKELVVLAMNIDAVNTKKGLEFAKRFLRTFRCMTVVDESHMIKDPNSKRTKKITEQIAPLSVSRRIATGTMISNGPLDAFGQFDFLRPGLLGTTSYRAFVAEYAELLPQNHRLVQEIREKQAARLGRPVKGAIQVVACDRQGNKKFKNMDKLSRLMAPYVYRVTKEECLDLPAKIYSTHFFELSAKQQRLYNKVAEELRFELEDGDYERYDPLTLGQKLQQLASGFIMVDGEVTDEIDIAEMEPRLKAMETVVETGEGQMIVWARFKQELRAISERLAERGRVVQYHGGTNDSDRNKAIDEFQSGKADFFIANPQSGGTGLTLTAASRVLFYSNSYNLAQRQQAEDRSHRIGTVRPVNYTDLAIQGCIDEKIIAALQGKERTAQGIMKALTAY